MAHWAILQGPVEAGSGEYRVSTKATVFLNHQQLMPPHSLFFGHLVVAAEVQWGLLLGAHGHYLADQIHRSYPDLGPTIYLDLWPFSDILLIITDPDVIAQFCAPDRLLPKHPGMKTFVYPITGGYDLNYVKEQT